MRVLAPSAPQPIRTAVDDRAEAVDDLRSFVTISRTHPDDVKERQVYARLDGRQSTLLYGDDITAEITPGAHELRLHNTLFWKTLRFTVEPGEHLEFAVINEARWWTWGVAGVLGAAPLFLRVERRVVR